jgi:hypothetical protein
VRLQAYEFCRDGAHVIKAPSAGAVIKTKIAPFNPTKLGHLLAKSR